MKKINNRIIVIASEAKQSRFDGNPNGIASSAFGLLAMTVIILLSLLASAPAVFAGDDDLNLAYVAPWGPPMVVQANKALEMTGQRMPQMDIQTKTLEITGRRQEPLVIKTKALEMTGYAGKNPPEPPAPAPVLPMTTSTALPQGYATTFQTKKIITYPLEMTGTYGQSSLKIYDIGTFAGAYKGKSEVRATPAERTQENISQSDIAKRNAFAVPRGAPSGFSEEEQGGQIQ